MKPILTFLRERGAPVTADEIKAAFGVRLKAVRRALSRFLEEGIVERTGGGTTEDPFRFQITGIPREPIHLELEEAQPQEDSPWHSSPILLPPSSGDAATLTTRPASPASAAAPSAPGSPPSTGIPATADMPAADPTTNAPSPWSTTPVGPTSSSSSAFMVWSVSPQRLIEAGLTLSIDDLSGLPEKHRKKLLRLAEGRGEPPGAVVALIAEYFVEAEDERAEGSLLDAVCWYLDNEVPW